MNALHSQVTSSFQCFLVSEPDIPLIKKLFTHPGSTQITSRAFQKKIKEPEPVIGTSAKHLGGEYKDSAACLWSPSPGNSPSHLLGVVELAYIPSSAQGNSSISAKSFPYYQLNIVLASQKLQDCFFQEILPLLKKNSPLNIFLYIPRDNMSLIDTVEKAGMEFHDLAWDKENPQDFKGDQLIYRMCGKHLTLPPHL